MDLKILSLASDGVFPAIENFLRYQKARLLLVSEPTSLKAGIADFTNPGTGILDENFSGI
jgi:hypothetical protein